MCIPGQQIGGWFSSYELLRRANKYIIVGLLESSRRYDGDF